MQVRPISNMSIPAEQGAAKWIAGSVALFASLLACDGLLAQQLTWVAQAPGPTSGGQVEKIDEEEVAGALQSVAVHPSDASIAYVGAVNGGIWKTINGMDPRPHWERQADTQNSLSIGAIEFDPTDAGRQTLVAGTGTSSSFGGEGATPAGLLRTTDGGTTWTAINGGGTLNGLNISGVALRGATIVIAVKVAPDPAGRGIWQSTDTGAMWRQISGVAGTGLPSGGATDLAGDPSDPGRLFANAGRRGIFRSTSSIASNIGVTWSKVSDTAMDALLAGADHVKLAVGTASNVFVAIVRGGALAGVFRSGNGGDTWAPMDLPQTTENGIRVGIHPGGQGGTHLSIAADRSNPQLVYLGGDRQPTQFNNLRQETGAFPNSLGAQDYSGRLFRGDASRPAGSQWTHLTHSNSLGAAGGGTAHGSAPHADSRDMAIAANGVLIEVDDGGIYRRTNPQSNAGDWFSMNGDIQVTEFHAVAWDALSNVVIGGTQDTGTPEQRLASDVRWRSVSTGDGGVVAVDDVTSTTQSTRYSSFYDLLGFRRQVFNAANVFQSQSRPALMEVNTTGNELTPQFYTPIKLNTVTPTRLIIGAGDGIYESADRGDTIRKIGPNIAANTTGTNAIAYGAAGNPNMLYVGAGAGVFIRTAAFPAALQRSAAYPGGEVAGVAIDPGNPRVAYVIDPSRVHRTANAGQTWSDITGNLAALAPGELRSIAYSTHLQGALVVGSDAGVFMALGPAFSTWGRLGDGFPRVRVLSLEYDAADRVLLAGTLGRGAWTLTFPAVAPPEQNLTQNKPPNQIRLAQANAAPSPVAEPPASEMKTFQLRPGVLVNPSQRRAYLMSPQGGIQAVDLAKGEPVWETKAAERPLTVAGGQLICQAEPAADENAMLLVTLDRATGRKVVAAAVPLPAGIKPSVTETMSGEFAVTADAVEGDAMVTWQFIQRPKKGIRPGTRSALAQEQEAEAAPEAAILPQQARIAGGSARSGTIRFNPTTGAASPGPAPGATLPPRRQAAILTADEPMAGIEGAQFLSVDGRHILVSRPVGEETAWEQYELTVYARDTKERSGAFKSHVAAVRFIVTDATAIYESQPYARQTGQALVEEPLKIRAVDLKTGNELWSRQVRDTSFVGPFPP